MGEKLYHLRSADDYQYLVEHEDIFEEELDTLFDTPGGLTLVTDDMGELREPLLYEVSAFSDHFAYRTDTPQAAAVTALFAGPDFTTFDYEVGARPFTIVTVTTVAYWDRDGADLEVGPDGQVRAVRHADIVGDFGAAAKLAGWEQLVLFRRSFLDRLDAQEALVGWERVQRGSVHSTPPVR